LQGIFIGGEKEMLRSITNIAIRTCTSFKAMLKDKKGADIVEWVAIIAVVVGIVIIISPQARSSIGNLFTNIFNSLSQMAGGR
jgi:Flp pilus assembly pilin Flp